ncbi:BAHD acyltransferase DCR [Heracleum sosnowskyi]|uniref:BAHD acyltransferase DCR n=1 Tax=Heracleum sosnowskyi TaxID=360622 RepID=A0AAD8M8Y2_9APIA|nr:BAHD acyltransferase DCR [Heracleum sosnowskyi]
MGPNMFKVRFLSKAYVKPKKSLGKKFCQLVTFDLPYLSVQYTQKILIYRGVEFEDMVEKLKDGLSVVLQDFYQLAGNLGKDQDGVLRVEYDDDSNGVEVVVASMEARTVSELMAAESANDLINLVPLTGVYNLEGFHRPLLAIQLTKLKDGLVLGCAFNHGVLDGTSMWHFMTSWANTCNRSQTLLIPPFLNRTAARNSRVPFNFQPPKQDLPLVRDKIFKFSNFKIEEMKSIVNLNPSDTSNPISTFQALSSHAWRAITRARQLKQDDHSVLTVFADIRKRINPPMPKTYFGNLIQAAFAVSTVGLLLTQPPLYSAKLIQKAIGLKDAKDIDETSKLFERSPKIFRLEDAGPNSVLMASSPRFEIYNVDFGWGRPESVRSGINNRFDGMVFLHEGKSGGKSIDVDISLPANTMQKLEADKEFLMEP